MKKITLFLILLGSLIVAQPTAIPSAVSFQGMLTNVDGSVYTDGDYELIFRLIRPLQDGNEQTIWEETHTASVNDGVFAVILGSITDLPTNVPGNAMLEIQVGEEILAPRQPLTSVPFAFRSNRAQFANQSIMADTAIYALNVNQDLLNTLNQLQMQIDSLINVVLQGSDTTVFAHQSYHSYYADTSGFSHLSNNAEHSDSSGFAGQSQHSIYADTASYSLSASAVDTVLFANESYQASIADTAIFVDLGNYSNNILADTIEAGLFIGDGSQLTGIEANLFSIDDFNDVLIANNSIWIGNDPSETIILAENNIAVGTTALGAITSGDNNVAVGHNALGSNTEGHSNTASGYQSLRYNTTGYYNTAVGGYTLYSNTTGIYNTASGYQALNYNTDGSQNTAAGYRSLLFNDIGNANTSIGYSSLFYNTSGSGNTALGNAVLYNNITGSNNTAVGDSAGLRNTSGNGNVFIGYQAGNNDSYVQADNKLVIANSNTTTPLIEGDFSSANLKVNASFEITGSMTMGVNSTIMSSTTFNGTATIIPVNTANGAVTITIDSDQKVAGRILVFKQISGDVNRFYIATEGSEMIQDNTSGLSNTTNEVYNQYATLTLFCDGLNWYDIVDP